MPGWFARLFPTKTLAAVREPTPVRIHARVISPNTLVSPISGHTAALIGWRFYAHYTDRSGQTAVERYDPILACARGGDLLLSTPEGTVLVPAQGREIRPAVTGRGVPLEVSPPPEAADVLQRSARGVVFYDELLLRNGDGVRLRATVAPCNGERGSAYRASGAVRSDFEALPRLGSIILEELLFDDG